TCVCSVLSPVIASPASMVYALSLHDALPIWQAMADPAGHWHDPLGGDPDPRPAAGPPRRTSRQHAVALPLQRHLHPPLLRRRTRSEEHTSELPSRENLVCRLLLDQKKSHSHT